MSTLNSKKTKKIDPRVKDILTLLTSGAILTAAILTPPSMLLYKEFKKYKWGKEQTEWNKFNIWRLKQILKRLRSQKIIEIKDDRIVITNKGKRKVLQYDLETMALKPKTDGKWRIIMYDISNMKKRERDFFRSMLKKLRLLQLQESVYLTPFVCDDEIEYLRQRFNVGNDVMVLKVVGIENEAAYKKYFGI
jgi:CRISPR/Cas system-associated endoribonuclease Cas2